MKRLPALAFAGLAAATVFAFFLTQHLKNANTVVGGNPQPLPAAFNPVNGRTCPDRFGNELNYHRTVLTLKPPQAGTVAVSVINRFATRVATISPGRSLAANQQSSFTWNGRESDGQIAPDGIYFFQVQLVQQGRTVNLPTPVTIMTHPPHPRVTSVALSNAAGAAKAGGGGKATTGGGATKHGSGSVTGPVVLTPPNGGVTVHFPLHDYKSVRIDVYRTDVSGKPQLINEFAANPNVGTAHWNGDAANRTPVPAGTYLIGITVQDQACNQASYPVVVPPAPGTTPDTGVTVRYLAATPPLAPTAAGSRASVAVDSPTGPYTWELRLAGKRRPLRQGTGVSGSSTLRLRLPKQVAGLYALTLTTGQYTTSVPLVADAAPGTRGARARVLVVLPMLTWQGENPVDDTGDGLPSTLSAGDQVALDRPLAHGLPVGYRQDAALLSFLRSHHLSYQLTTDVALAEGVGPSLVDRWGVALAGSETWLPASLAQKMLKDFVQAGGRVLSIGTEALKGSSVISGYPADPVAARPVRRSTDLFGAQHGPLTSTRGELVTELTDQLNILGVAPALSGFGAYTPIEPPAGVPASLAGIATSVPAVAAFKLGSGYVVEIGLAGFNSSLAGNIDAQELLTRIWSLLAK